MNGEPLMMTDEGMLPTIIPKIKKFERSLSMKLPPYSIGFWVLPEAKVITNYRKKKIKPEMTLF